MQKLQVTLGDNDPESDVKIPVALSVDQNFIQFEAEGFNACGSADEIPIGDGNKSVVAIEIWQGQLRVLVWADINQEDPTHTIELDDARISNRWGEPCSECGYRPEDPEGCEVCGELLCKYCGGKCPFDEDNACDGYQGDIDNLYNTKEE